MTRSIRLLSAWLCLTSCGWADDFWIEISGNGIERQNAIASIALPDSAAEWTAAKVVSSDGRVISAQISTGSPKSLVLMIDSLAASETLRVHVADASSSERDDEVRIVDRDGGYLFKVRGKPVFRYNHAVVESPDGIDPVYRRSGHIHPLYNPQGQVVTDDFSPDHAHQHGVMFAWTNCSFEGRDVNFWEQKQGLATVRHDRTLGLSSGPLFAELKVRIMHVDKSSGSEKPVLSEDWRLRVYDIANEHFVFDLLSNQTCVADSPLTVKEYHYGGLAIRGHRSWTKDSSGFLTSNGKTRSNGNHDRTTWCDIHGLIDGKPTGVTILCHPENFRAPQPVRLHPSMPYFCYAPLVLGEFQIGENAPLVSNYRFVTHIGEVDPDETNRMWLDFAHPVAIRYADSPR